MQILISARDKASRVVRGVTKHFKKLGKVAKKVGKGIGSALGKVAKSLLSFKTALVGVAGVAGMGLMIKSSIQVIYKLGKVSSKLGVTSQELQRFRYAAKLAGVEESALDMGLQRFIRRVGEAAQGTGEAKDALKKMGIQLTGSNGKILSATNLLGQVANALKNTKDPAERLRLAFKLFDSEGVAMVNMLKQGKTALNSTMMEADKLGFVLSEKVVSASQRVNDAFFKMTAALGGVKNNLVGALAPALERMGTWWTEFAASFSTTIQPLWTWLEEHLASISTGFGSATEAGAKWGNIIGWHTVELVKKITNFFTKMKEGKTDFQRFKEIAAKTWQSVKEGASAVLYVIRAMATAIKAVVSGFRTLNRWADRVLPDFLIGGQAGRKALTGGRASGGGVSAGQSYLVGERGAEVFTPTTSGRISPNASGGTNVTNIYTNATAHGINNALGSRGDNVSRGARVGMNIARATGMGGFGNLSMARAR